jgi:NAD(P)-dependent dehydrogenase (short-subunit alcohol dehydrogenase family)
MTLLDGRVAIVTGGGRGIGREHALELARQGATVVVNDVGVGLRGEPSEESPADSVASQIVASGGQAIPDSTSVTDWDGAGNLVARVIERFGRLDIVVNNAGIVREGRIHSVSEEDWDAVIDVHVKGSFTITKHACAYWRKMAKDGGGQVAGRVINTTSRAGLFGSEGLVVYGTAKAAIVGLTINTAIEMERYGVTANAICPIAMTRMLGTSPHIDTREPSKGWDPLAPGNSSPIVAWLASDHAGWLTGQVLEVSGNRLIRISPCAEAQSYEGGEPARLRAEEIDHIVKQLYGLRPTPIKAGATSSKGGGASRSSQ